MIRAAPAGRVEIERRSSIGTTIRVQVRHVTRDLVEVHTYRRLKGDRWYTQKHEQGQRVRVRQLGVGCSTWAELVREAGL